jgi:hypothetical protein
MHGFNLPNRTPVPKRARSSICVLLELDSFELRGKCFPLRSNDSDSKYLLTYQYFLVIITHVYAEPDVCLSTPLLSKLVHTALSATDRPPEVFSSPTNTATNPPRAYDTQIVIPKAIKMNTCTKTGEGGTHPDLDRNLCVSRQILWNHTLAQKR